VPPLWRGAAASAAHNLRVVSTDKLNHAVTARGSVPMSNARPVCN